MAALGKHPDITIHAKEPFNAGPRLAHLVQSGVTPVEQFYVRSHAPVPAIDTAAFRLSVGGLTGEPLSLSLGALQERFPKTTVEATLQCAGNRRDELSAVEPIDDQVQWGADAIGNAAWGGVSLAEVLRAAGVEAEAAHVAFTGLDEVPGEDGTFGFGGSIPIDKAMSGEVLLAYEMNGKPLPPVHGAPVRTIVPGYIGARSVKWLGEVVVGRAPSDNHFQAHAYKLFPPHVRADSADWPNGLMLGELSLNCAICAPGQGEAVPAGEALVQGYAMAGGERTVARVDVSPDGGESWVEAELGGEAQPWRWRLWQATLKLEPGQHEVVARAYDSAANTMPDDVRPLWNFKGYMNNAWHRVQVEVRA